MSQPTLGMVLSGIGFHDLARHSVRGLNLVDTNTMHLLDTLSELFG